MERAGRLLVRTKAAAARAGHAPFARASPGDLYAEVKIMVPDRLSERERGLFDSGLVPGWSTFDPRRSR